jgi:membrane protein YdbS with pleckstrin-like domain
MMENILYNEKISSNLTSALFLVLTMIFSLLMLWRLDTSGLELLSGVFIFLTLLFLFYFINYRMLQLQITSQDLRLKFGIFYWRVPLENIEQCGLDDLPLIKKYGGAGIHFMTVRGRYRASFNFLEYPRVVVLLISKRGPVQDISFSTRRPEDIIRLIQGMLEDMQHSSVE